MGSANKRDLSQPRSNRSPQRFGAPCAQVRVFEKGDTPPDDNSDSDEDDEYDTPPESLEYDNNPEEENDDPNMPENTDDDISDDEDNEILHNMAENDSAIETGNLRNFPDLLRIHNSGQDTNSDEETLPPSRCTGARPKEHLPIGSWPRRNNPPLREVVLPQLHQTPCPRGVCVPPYDEPPEPWCGFGSEDQLMDFLADKIPFYEEEEQSVTKTIKLVEREIKTPDPIKDMEKYIHTVLDSDDEEAKKCKLEHNTALTINTQMYII